MRRFFVPLVVLMLAVLYFPVSTAQAEDGRCFHETQQCISGRFEAYWEQTGGLAVFGFPIIPPTISTNETSHAYYAQAFERNRFEHHPENAAPYDVLLGRLGDDRLRQLGIAWQQLPHANGAQNGCLWFAQTMHNVCDQAASLGFRTYWETHGIQDARLSPYARSLALFGLPLTEPRLETNQSGDDVLTQWFERARFEWHPDKPDSFKVLLGLLGDEMNSTTVHPPARLIIPSIGLDMSVVSASLDEQSAPIVPKHDVGWFSTSALPGQGSNIVFWGHVLRFLDAPDIPAPFAQLGELQVGAPVTIVSTNGTQHHYRITQQLQVRPDQVQYIEPTSSERVTLVSCVGDNVIQDGTLTKQFRLINIAEPAD